MIDPNKIGAEQRAALEKEILRDFILIQIQTYVDSVASAPAVDELRPHIMEAGKMFADAIIDLYEIQGDDLNKIGEVTNLAEEFLGIDHIEMERTSSMIVRVGGSKCPWRTGQVEACKAVHEIFMNGMCTRVDPEHQCRFTQMITNGDPVCCWVLEKKKE